MTVNGPSFFAVFAGIAGIYISQSVLAGVTFQALPAIMRSTGAALDQIGIVFLAMVPWALKFLWSPAIERLRRGQGTRTRTIVICGQVAVALILVIVGASGAGDFLQVFCLLLAAATVAATIDIPVDGTAVEQLQPEKRGWGNTAQVGGAYLGFVIGGGVYLWGVDAFGFALATYGLAILILVITLPFTLLTYVLPQITVGEHRASLHYAWQRREVKLGLLLVLVCGFGPRVTLSLSGPFMIDNGVSLSLLGTINGAAALFAGLTGTVFGGLLSHWFPPGRAVVAAVAVEALAIMAMVIVASRESPELMMMISVNLVLTGSMAMAFVTIYSLLMRGCSLKQAGVDFTIFQAADAGVAALGGMLGGQLAASMGYVNVFALATLTTALAVAFCASTAASIVRTD
ncbi:MAG: MFS transporter [Pseudomonadota bacterium]